MTDSSVVSSWLSSSFPPRLVVFGGWVLPVSSVWTLVLQMGNPSPQAQDVVTHAFLWWLQFWGVAYHIPPCAWRAVIYQPLPGARVLWECPPHSPLCLGGAVLSHYFCKLIIILFWSVIGFNKVDMFVSDFIQYLTMGAGVAAPSILAPDFPSMAFKRSSSNSNLQEVLIGSMQEVGEQLFICNICESWNLLWCCYHITSILKPVHWMETTGTGMGLNCGRFSFYPAGINLVQYSIRKQKLYFVKDII